MPLPAHHCEYSHIAKSSNPDPKSSRPVPKSSLHQESPAVHHRCWPWASLWVWSVCSNLATTIHASLPHLPLIFVVFIASIPVVDDFNAGVHYSDLVVHWHSHGSCVSMALKNWRRWWGERRKKYEKRRGKNRNKKEPLVPCGMCLWACLLFRKVRSRLIPILNLFVEVRENAFWESTTKWS